MAKAVFALTDSRTRAEALVEDLKAAGISRNKVSVLLPDRGESREFAHEHHTKAPEGAVTGATTGGVLGGVFGWLTGIGALAIPGLGPFLAAGPLMAALSAAAIGAAAGGIVGALVGMGIPEYEAKMYEGKLREGNILIAVHTDDRKERERARDLLHRGGADHVAISGEKDIRS